MLDCKFKIYVHKQLARFNKHLSVNSTESWKERGKANTS